MANVDILFGSVSGVVIEAASITILESARNEYVLKESNNDDFPRYVELGSIDGEEIETANVNDLPSDYEPNKYLYVNGEFILNPDYSDEEEETDGEV